MHFAYGLSANIFSDTHKSPQKSIQETFLLENQWGYYLTIASSMWGYWGFIEFKNLDNLNNRTYFFNHNNKKNRTSAILLNIIYILCDLISQFLERRKLLFFAQKRKEKDCENLVVQVTLKI